MKFFMEGSNKNETYISFNVELCNVLYKDPVLFN